jgi:hypothetical protein
MPIAETFTPGRSFLGGVLIGAGASIFLATTGRIAGFSGVVKGFISFKKDWHWRGIFVASLLSTGLLANALDSSTFIALEPQELSIPGIALGGLLTGIGTNIGNGCTSGHGVCGLGRLSLRSLVATLDFFTIALGASIISRKFFGHLLYTRSPEAISVMWEPQPILRGAVFMFIGTIAYITHRRYQQKTSSASVANNMKLTKDQKRSHRSWTALLATAGSAAVMGIGLALSGMTKPNKVRGFLDLTNSFKLGWDPSLAFTLAGAVLTTLSSFRFILPPQISAYSLLPRPLLAQEWHLPSRTDVDKQLVGGAAVFGLGWGLAGLCPGPAIMGIASARPAFLLWATSFALGTLGIDALRAR